MVVPLIVYGMAVPADTVHTSSDPALLTSAETRSGAVDPHGALSVVHVPAMPTSVLEARPARSRCVSVASQAGLTDSYSAPVALSSANENHRAGVAPGWAVASA